MRRTLCGKPRPMRSGRHVAAHVEKLSPRFLDLAEKNPNDPIALDSLVQVVLQEIWLQNNTTHVRERQQKPEARAIALLLRDHVRSDKIEEGIHERKCYLRRLFVRFGAL